MKHVALVIVDMQNAYFRNAELKAKKAILVKHCNELISSATQQNAPIFNVTTAHKRNVATWTLNMREDEQGYLYENDPDTATVDGLDTTGAIGCLKTRDSAFYDTTLASMLRNLQIETIILVGVSTHTCIFQTAADAYAHNLKVVIANDAVATHDNMFHESSLKLLEQEYRQAHLSNSEIIRAYLS